MDSFSLNTEHPRKLSNGGYWRLDCSNALTRLRSILIAEIGRDFLHCIFGLTNAQNSQEGRSVIVAWHSVSLLAFRGIPYVLIAGLCWAVIIKIIKRSKLFRTSHRRGLGQELSLRANAQLSIALAETCHIDGKLQSFHNRSMQ